MTETLVQGYSDSQIFERLKLVTSFATRRTLGIPLIVGIQSLEDKYDSFDDKFYVYDENNEFVMVTSGTTNAGSTGLKDFLKWNPKGTGVWKTNEFYPKAYKNGLHNGKMVALRLSTQIKHYRDNNKNEKAEQIGEIHLSNTNANLHGIDYGNLKGNTKVINKIGAWGVMCNVVNDMKDYEKIINFVKPYEYCDYAILKEWDKNEITV